MGRHNGNTSKEGVQFHSPKTGEGRQHPTERRQRRLFLAIRHGSLSRNFHTNPHDLQEATGEHAAIIARDLQREQQAQ